MKFYINIGDSNINFFTESRNKNPEISLIDMCQEFIKLYGQYIKYSENEDSSDTSGNDKDEDDENEDSSDTSGNSEENKDENKNTLENEISKSEGPMDNNVSKEDIQPVEQDENKEVIKLKGSEIKPPKTSFISLKMEIDTVLMFKLLIVLMIITIVMIIIFLLRIEFKPLLNYKLPNDYTHFTIQPPYNNVKKFSIFNKYNDSGMTTLFNLNKNKDTPKLSKSQEIKQEIVNEIKPVMDTSEQEEKVEGFTNKPIKGECFSSSYEFGI